MATPSASNSLIYSSSSSSSSSSKLSFTSLKKPYVDRSSLFLGLPVSVSNSALLKTASSLISRRHVVGRCQRDLSLVPANQRWMFEDSQVDGPDIWNKTWNPKAKDHVNTEKPWYMVDAPDRILERLASVILGKFRSLAPRPTHHGFRVSCCSMTALLAVTASPTVFPLPVEAAVSRNEISGITTIEVDISTRLDRLQDMIKTLLLADLDPATAKVAIGILGPFLSAFAFLFILRIVMSWYPKLPVGKFPYILAYAPTEPLLIPTRKLIPPVGGVDVTPVVWFAVVSFLNEILVGPQGLLVLVSQQVG